MSLWKARIDHSLADLAQASAFAAEGEAFLKPGGLMVAWEIRHDDFESQSAEEVDAICERFEQALGQVGDMDLLHVVHHRLPAPTYPERELPTRAANLVDRERRASFGNERYWLTHSRIYLSHYFPPEARRGFRRPSLQAAVLRAVRPAGNTKSSASGSGYVPLATRSRVSRASAGSAQPKCSTTCICASPDLNIR
jgi:hypothetical protein